MSQERKRITLLRGLRDNWVTVLEATSSQRDVAGQCQVYGHGLDWLALKESENVGEGGELDIGEAIHKGLCA